MNTVVLDTLWALVTLGFLGLCFLGVRAVQSRIQMKAELSRKLVHMAMAVAVLHFPWTFTNRITVGIIAGIATAGLLAVRLFAPKGESDLGGVLYRVGRIKSVGELVYPPAVAAVYYIAPTPEMYVIPILVLGFADSMAALVGTEYARRQLAAQRESPKSMEGAVAFFSAAFICVISPLLLLSALSGPVILISALLAAFLATLLELVCSFGLDNFFLPFFIVVFLQSITRFDIGQLWFSFGLMLCYLAVAVFFLKKKKHITTLGVAEALLVLFLGTLLGGLHWAVAPVVLSFTYSVLPALRPEERARPLNYHDVESNFVPGLLIVIAGSLMGMPPLAFWVYSAYYACMTAKNHTLRMHNYFPQSKYALHWAFLRGLVLQLAPAVLICRIMPGGVPPLRYIIWALAAMLTEILLVKYISRRFSFPEVSIRVGWISSMSSLVLVAVMLLI